MEQRNGCSILRL